MASPASTPFTVSPKVMDLLSAAGAGNLDLLKKLASQLDDGRGMATTIAAAKDEEQWGALHFAARKGNIELCKYLLEELKLDVNPKDVKGDTPLHIAAGAAHIETTKYLIDQGADPLISNANDVTVLHYCAGSGKIELLDFILSKGVDIDYQDSCGSALTYAASCARADAVKFLLERQANPHAEVKGCTPLSCSVTSCSLECLKLLIQWGAKVNITSPARGTVLHVAASKGNLGIINCLLEAGADPNVRDEGGLTPIQLAARHGHSAAVKIFSRHGNRAAVEILSPKTSEIKNIPRSVDGIKVQEQSECGDMQVNLHGLGVCSTPVSRQISQKSKEAKRKATEARLRGYIAVNREDYLAALNAFTQARVFDPNDATLLSDISLCRIHLGEAERALADASACRALRPDLAEACYREGAALRSLQRFDEAVNSFREGFKLDPEDADLLNAFREASEEARNFRSKEDQKGSPSSTARTDELDA